MKLLRILSVLALAGIGFSASAQVVLSGTSYSQNFDGIASGYPAGWTGRTSASASSLGTVGTFTGVHNNWANTGAGFWNYASTTNNDNVTAFVGTEINQTQTNAVNRSFGVRQTGGTGFDPGPAFTLQIQDTLGFGNFQMGVDFNMLNEQPRTTIWSVEYGVGAAPTTFTSVGFYTNQGSFGTTRKTYSFGNSLNNQGTPVWIRIVALAATTGSGNRDTFGIDNFQLSFEAVSVTVDPPVVTVQPLARTNNGGTTATFAATVTGTSPLTYEWRKDGTAISDGSAPGGSIVTGAATPNLAITNVTTLDGGDYALFISNTAGSVTSQVARLTVLDPAVLSQPFNRTNMAGDRAFFSVNGGGTAPLYYQWLFNGAPIPDATSTNLALLNLHATNAGSYSAIVSNTYGSVTSAVAALVVVPTPSQRLARWSFNSPPDNLPATGVLTTTADSLVSGTAIDAGGTTHTFAAGSTSDLDAGGLNNSGWNTATYAAATAENKARGAQFNVSTEGYQNILVSWEQQHSATASKYFRFQYSLNGTDFTDAGVISLSTNGSFFLFTNTLAGISGVNNNASFAFRLVAEFESTATGGGTAGYVATTAGSSYGTTGTARFDWVNVYGETYVAPPLVPVMTVTSSGTDLVLTWPVSSSTGFTLQSTLSLAPANWQDAGLTPTVDGANYKVTVGSPTGTAFFRLVKP